MSKILVVDDDEGILGALQMMLADEGHEVETAVAEQQVYKAVKNFNPELIILDILLSGSDGRDICKKLKNDKKTRHIPIIMASAHPSAEKTISQYDANDFLAKPFGMQDLNEIIYKYIS